MQQASERNVYLSLAYRRECCTDQVNGPVLEQQSILEVVAGKTRWLPAFPDAQQIPSWNRGVIVLVARGQPGAAVEAPLTVAGASTQQNTSSDILEPMTTTDPIGPAHAIVPASTRQLSDSDRKVRSVRLASTRRWSPPEGIMPEDIQRVIAAAASERDRLFLRVLWATGGRVSEAVPLRAMDVRRDSLVLPNRKNPNQPVKTVYLPGGLADLPGELLLWQREHQLADGAPLFFSRKRKGDGGLRPITRQRAWEIVKDASRRAGVQVLAMRPSRDGGRGEPAPVHPHIFRHSRVRQTLRSTRSLPIVQKQAGWARLQQAYLTPDDEEVRQAMAKVDL